MSEDNLTPLKFHFFSLRFVPHKEDEGKITSTKILRDVITYLTRERVENRNGHLIDRHAGRKNELPRELFMTSSVFKPKEGRITCSLALLRSGKVPKLKPADKFKLVPIDSTLGSIAEETHFYIDYNKDFAVLCVEYNYWGPRISDIEYYLRNVANYTLRLSKATHVEMYMDSTIDKTLADLKNVLSINVKMHPPKLAQMDKDLVGKYFTGMNTIGNRLKPRYLKMEALYQTPGRSVTSSELNKEANGMVRELLNKFKSRPFNIDCFENFVVEYEDKDGNEEVFNLLKEKKEVLIEVDLDKIKKKREIYDLVCPHFDEFMGSL